MIPIAYDKDVVRIAKTFGSRAEELLPNHASLFSGQCGLSLLYSNLYLFSRQKAFRKRSIEFLERSIELLEDGSAGCTLANGVAGVGWLIKYLVKKKVISETDVSILGDFDDILLESLKIDSLKDNNHYDLLFGLIGKGVYFLEDYHGLKSEALTIIFQKLKSLSVETEDGMLWYDNLGKEQRNEEEAYFNFGLAHGLPSIIIFLSKLSDSGLHQEECRKLIRSIVLYLLKQKLLDCISEYPSSGKSTQPSRLAWCYGDLGIAMSYIYASKALGDGTLLNEAKRIALQASLRDVSNSDLRSDSSGLIENGVCHGSMGLVYLFSSLYEYFGDTQFLRAREYWLLNSFNSGGIPISRDYVFEGNKWVENGSLINGYCGMGISLLNVHSKSCDGLNGPFFIC
jgi:lantibiotic biosynthesis protein